jgi:hypothetical protein
MPADAPQEKTVEKTPGTPNSDRPRSFFARNSASDGNGLPSPSVEDFEEKESRPPRWSMGVLNDRFTHEVPGMLSLTLFSSNEN